MRWKKIGIFGVFWGDPGEKRLVGFTMADYLLRSPPDFVFSLEFLADFNLVCALLTSWSHSSEISLACSGSSKIHSRFSLISWLVLRLEIVWVHDLCACLFILSLFQVFVHTLRGEGWFLTAGLAGQNYFLTTFVEAGWIGLQGRFWQTMEKLTAAKIGAALGKISATYQAQHKEIFTKVMMYVTTILIDEPS